MFNIDLRGKKKKKHLTHLIGFFKKIMHLKMKVNFHSKKSISAILTFRAHIFLFYSYMVTSAK